jgi:hypothetical protein
MVLARALNARGVPTARGVPWSPVGVINILKRATKADAPSVCNSKRRGLSGLGSLRDREAAHPGEWNDYDVFADGVVVGCIFRAAASPERFAVDVDAGLGAPRGPHADARLRGPNPPGPGGEARGGGGLGALAGGEG